MVKTAFASDVLYDVDVNYTYEQYLRVTQSEGKTPVDIEEYINNMGPLWEYNYNQKSAVDRISELGTVTFIMLALVEPLTILGDLAVLKSYQADTQILADKVNKVSSNTEIKDRVLNNDKSKCF